MGEQPQEITLEQRVATLERAHASLRADLDTNTKMTASVKSDTAALVAFTTTMAGFATFCRHVGKGLRWLGLYISPIALAVVTAWAVIKGNKAP